MSRWIRWDQKDVTCLSKLRALLFRHKAHAKDVLTCCTHIHGEQVVHCLRIESLGVKICKCGGNSLKALCCFLHGGVLSQNNRAGLNVSMDLYMSSQATECECDLVLELRWNGVLTRAFPHLCLGGL